MKRMALNEIEGAIVISEEFRNGGKSGDLETLHEIHYGLG